MAKSTARNKMMDYLAVRDHSELELRRKLSKHFEDEEIEKAIRFGKENKWIPNTPEALAELSGRAAATLSRKKKGIVYINSFLYEIGLPEISADYEHELAKAKELIKNKYKVSKEAPRDERIKAEAKLSRFLQSRGFQNSVIREVLKYAKNQS